MKSLDRRRSSGSLFLLLSATDTIAGLSPFVSSSPRQHSLCFPAVSDVVSSCNCRAAFAARPFDVAAAPGSPRGCPWPCRWSPRQLSGLQAKFFHSDIFLLIYSFDSVLIWWLEMRILFVFVAGAMATKTNPSCNFVVAMFLIVLLSNQVLGSQARVLAPEGKSNESVQSPSQRDSRVTVDDEGYADTFRPTTPGRSPGIGHSKHD
ncbi:hypothetical protein SASPL_143480 [Salvia splendens]|uniref:Uncharacterized protein n=1 Tax=Salvia splendens TaxID=180675 RepID=A0A8X8WNR0_SALSN|nr:hypothetical protein SASPL_143480 [Salvia splendens]